MLLRRGLRLNQLVSQRRLAYVLCHPAAQADSTHSSNRGGASIGGERRLWGHATPSAAAGHGRLSSLTRCYAATHIKGGASRSLGLGDSGTEQQHQQQQHQHQLSSADALEAFVFKVAPHQLASKAKARLDAYLAAQLPDASRAKIQASIKAGLVTVNGSPAVKASATVKAGDTVSCSLLPPEPCTAEPEQIPLNIVYEDAHLIVVNKAPGMVVHISPGHTRGTLVNALLGHCNLPPMTVPSGSLHAGGSGLTGATGLDGDEIEDLLSDEDEDLEDNAPLVPAHPSAAAAQAASSTTNQQRSQQQQQQPVGAPPPGVLRPGIVHRLDKGTSGLMVVAKDDLAHMRLCEQFKARTVSRIYQSITLGVPAPAAGRIATNVARDPNDRLKMTALGYGANRGRTAASNYRVVRRIGGGAAALVEWKLETGRTHQIRVHAKHAGHPLLADDTYSSGNAASARTLAGRRTSLAPQLRAALDAFDRPALHALTLGFDHPLTGERLHFKSKLPGDFLGLLQALEELLSGDGS